MKKILFIVNGLGLGNSTRCESIMQCVVSKGAVVDILTSNNGVYFFKNRGYPSHVYEFHGFYYGRKGDALSIWRTIMAIPHFAWIFLKNVKLLRNLLRTNNYSALVIDSDYTLFWLKKWIAIPVFAINNADVVVGACSVMPVLPSEIRMQYFVEVCDHWFHSNVPDVVLSPSILPFSSHENGRIKHFPPFIRSGLAVRPGGAQLNNILVMLSGSQFGTSAKFLKQLNPLPGVTVDVVGQDGESNEWITFHGKLQDNKDLINRADMMVVNGGFSAVSEAVVLRKPVVVIPVPNHAEQFINGKVIEDLGLGLSATMENVVPRINEMVRRFPDFVQAHQNFNINKNGAEEASKVILDKI
ncbi:MAG: hypothetical protein IPN90_01265 [Elusimicrobia bacterium]|nr:hypothetical protein [Elusimicrobiota bacterium]